MIHFGQSIPPFIQTTNNHTNYCLSRKTISLQLQWRQKYLPIRICRLSKKIKNFTSFFTTSFLPPTKTATYLLYSVWSRLLPLLQKKNQNNQRCLTLNIIFFSYVFILTLFMFALTHEFIRIFLKHSNSLSLLLLSCKYYKLYFYIYFIIIRFLRSPYIFIIYFLNISVS